MSKMGAEMIKSIKFEGESIEELEVWYYAPKHECSAAEFARECGKLVRADFGLASLYEIKFEKFTPCEPDDFMKERITAALSAAALSDELKISQWAEKTTGTGRSARLRRADSDFYVSGRRRLDKFSPASGL